MDGVIYVYRDITCILSKEKSSVFKNSKYLIVKSNFEAEMNMDVKFVIMDITELKIIGVLQLALIARKSTE